MRHRTRNLYRRRTDWGELIGGIFLLTIGAAALLAMFGYSLTFDCWQRLHLTRTTEHLCRLMGL